MTAPGAAPRQPARLELLVRSEDGESFETREIASPAAYLQLRPQRLPDDQWELAQLPSGVPGTKKYVLKSRRAENYLQLDEEERFLWQQMDGRASMQDIAVAYVMRYGSFDFEKIPQLIRKLLLADLLTLRPMSRLRDILARNRRNPAARAMEAGIHAIERLNVSSRRWNDLFERIHRWGGWLLFTPAAVIGLIVLTAISAPSALRWGTTPSWPSSPSSSPSSSPWPFTSSCTRSPACTMAAASRKSASSSTTWSCRPSTPTSPTSSWPRAARVW
ncbi:MAG: hypothetical protein DME10_11420 [Candidatus Rokuibacteriota bacterium]|nr:MAG: hypothetical protein DME10_11420 [Candidatus Rokubacteria bacterium]